MAKTRNSTYLSMRTMPAMPIMLATSTKPNVLKTSAMPGKQRGVALLTILLLVVVATVLATTMILKQQRALRETGVLVRQQQALNYALAGEAFVSELLVADSDTNSTDSLQDIWAESPPPFPVGGGLVTTQVKELSGRFNLNNLYHDGAVDEAQLDYFRRLLEVLGIAPEIAEAVLDWQDPDNETTGNGGAEAEYYAAQKILPANQPFIDVNELSLVRGVDAEVLGVLLPHVFAAPNVSQINVNTATIPVLAALSESLALADVEGWVTTRAQNAPLESVDDFYAVVPFSNIPREQQNSQKPFLSTQSQYFLSQVQVTLDGKQRYLTSTLLRDNKITTVYQRNLTPFFIEPADALP